MTLNPSGSSASALYCGISGSSSSKLIENPNFCSCCLTTFFVFLLFPFFATSILKINKINHSTVSQYFKISNFLMKASTSKSQLVSTRSKNSVQDYSNLSSRTNRRKSQVQKESKSRGNIQREEDKEDLEIIKNQQLLSIIDTFYSTLCSLPMEMLMNASDPQFWLNQQEDTLKELQKKLGKIEKHKDYEYYQWKLQSVSKLLENITANMAMLQRITHLKGYYSGTETSNYRSRGSSSINSELGEAKITTFQSKYPNQMVSYDHYEIKDQNRPIKTVKSNRSDQLMAETIQSEEEMSEEELQMVHSEVFPKKQAHKKREVPQVGENKDTQNIQKQFDSSHFYKVKSKELESKDKTLSKIPAPKQDRSQRTLSNYTLQDRFLQDRMRTGVQTIPNSSGNYPPTCEQSIDTSKQKFPPTVEGDCFSKATKSTQYIQMIKQMRLQLLEKDKQLQNLLINQQQFEEGIEIFRAREKQKNMQIIFLKQNISITNKQKQKMALQIKRLMEYQQELKETIKFQRERNRKEEREKDKIEEKYYQQANSREELLQEIARLKEENKQSRKKERVMKEKMDVYKQKYFNVYAELQTSRETEELLVQELKEKNLKTVSRYEVIRGLVEYQKEKLNEESFL